MHSSFISLFVAYKACVHIVQIIVVNISKLELNLVSEIKNHGGELINNPKIKKLYQDGVTEVLKKVFHEYWVESTEKEMSGFYGIESDSARSILNNLNTNFNTF